MNVAALKALYATDPDGALDSIYAEMSDHRIAGRYAEIDAALADPEVLTLPTDLLLGVITASRWCRSKLSKRAALMEGARRVFDERGEDTEDLLANL